jgi:hypothetical protein
MNDSLTETIGAWGETKRRLQPELDVARPQKPGREFDSTVT